ncbi:MAG: PLP-dependent transferase [Syntrophales bacterium]
MTQNYDDGIVRGIWGDNTGEPAALVPIRGCKTLLQYDLKGLPGAMQHPFLAAATADRLEEAKRNLKNNKIIPNAEILIWDAYRTKEVQRKIFSQYQEDIRNNFPTINKVDLYRKTCEFVSSPEMVFPHGTGGAVDVTLIVDGHMAYMGSDFDEFVPESAADWFRQRMPKTPSEVEAARNREVLRKAMEDAGFVGIESEYWHFEFGTQTWAIKTGNKPLLTSVLPKPLVEGPASTTSIVPLRQPAFQSGVAQIFTSQKSRAESLAHKKPGHYYARTSHPTNEGLKQFIQAHVIPSNHLLLCQSGLSACLLALKAVVPIGGQIVYDNHIYYEVQRSAKTMAKQLGWKLSETNFSHLRERLQNAGINYQTVDAFYCDNPRNWWLEGFDIERIAQKVHEIGALLIVDTSVQPLQDVLAKGADIAVCSLSKYPSKGKTIGGCVATNNENLMKRIRQIASDEGHVLAPEAALTIWEQITNIHDHMKSVSEKAEMVSAFLRNRSAIQSVRIPDKKFTDGYVGGQLTFDIKNFQCGYIMEKLIGHNSLSTDTALHLACTFGASYTTFEHFASNVRYRTGIRREDTNEIAIPSTFVRLGIGCESADRIINDLSFYLAEAVNIAKGETIEHQVHSEACGM